MSDLDRAHLAVLQHGPAIGLAVDPLHPVDRASPQEGQHRRPVIGRAVAQPHGDADRGDRAFGQGDDGLAPQGAWRPAIELLEGLVEPADAAEARGERDLGHRQPGVVDQLLGEQHATGLGHGDRRGAEMLLEQAAELASADAQALGQRVDAGLVAVERALGDERKAARHRVRGAAPGAEIRRRLRPAAQAGAEASLLRRGGRGKEAAVLELGRACRADRAAVDPGRGDADEQAAVEARVTGLERPVAGLGIELFHGPRMPRARSPRSRFSDMVGPRPATWRR